MLRALPLTCLLLALSTCAPPEPEPASPPPPGNPPGGQPAGPTCACYFETWSLRTGCGTFCNGEAKLTCTASGARVEEGGCRFDAGAGMDGGSTIETPDGGASSDPDAGGPPLCVPRSSSCTCTVRPYSGGSLTLIIPCCSTLCVGSQDKAWECSAEGGVSNTPIPAVCRR